MNERIPREVYAAAHRRERQRWTKGTPPERIAMEAERASGLRGPPWEGPSHQNWRRRCLTTALRWLGRPCDCPDPNQRAWAREWLERIRLGHPALRGDSC